MPVKTFEIAALNGATLVTRGARGRTECVSYMHGQFFRLGGAYESYADQFDYKRANWLFYNFGISNNFLM
jgi:hypothetical protein